MRIYEIRAPIDQKTQFAIQKAMNFLSAGGEIGVSEQSLIAAVHNLTGNKTFNKHLVDAALEMNNQWLEKKDGEIFIKTDQIESPETMPPETMPPETMPPETMPPEAEPGMYPNDPSGFSVDMMAQRAMSRRQR